MRKIAFLLALTMSFIGLQAQEYYINLHNSGQVIYQNNVNGINSMYFQGNPASLYINGVSIVPVSAFDSITFVLQEPPQPGDAVTLTYNGSAVSIDNPYANEGIDITNNGADVTVYSTKAGASYLVEGSSSNGSLTIYSNSAFSLTLSYLNLTSNTTAAINLASPVDVDLTVQGICTIADGANSAVNGALYAAGNLIVGPGDNLRVTGNAKHGILVDGDLTVNDGNIDILDSDSDGIHVNGALNWNSGYLYIPAAGSDGLDVSGNVTIQNGDLQISTNAEGARCIKVSGVFTMDDGHLDMGCSGRDSKGLKADSLVFINGGNIEIANSGNISKGIKADGDINISGGTITIEASGSTEVIDYDPTYCTAIKGDVNIIISGGDITINLPTSNHGGKGISCAGNMTISGNNTINIETHGDGASYNTTSGTDTYSSSCLRAEGNMQILSGTITLSSTGKGGKGIKVGTKTGNTYSGTYTQGDTDGTGPTLTISTTGTQVVSGGGGGWPPGGGSSASGSAKAIKVGGAATVYGGKDTKRNFSLQSNIIVTLR